MSVFSLNKCIFILRFNFDITGWPLKSLTYNPDIAIKILIGIDLKANQIKKKPWV